MEVKSIPIDKIDIVENIRIKEDPALKSLMESIKQHGLKEPIGVGATKSRKYVLMYGFRRLKAYKKLGFKTIPAVLESEPEMAELLITNAIENIQRKDITPIELGRICLKLTEFGLTPGEMAARIGMTKGKIDAAIATFQFIPEKLRDKIRFMPPGHTPKKGDIPASVAYQVINLRRRYSLSKTVAESLLEEVRVNELSKRDIDTIGLLVNDGMTPEKAITERRKYTPLTLNCLLEKTEVEKLTKEYKMSIAEILRRAASGEIKPISIFRNKLKIISRGKRIRQD